MKEKVVLAFSGGLDTSVIVPWLRENYDYDVIAVCINVGQDKELTGLEDRAKAMGVAKLYIEDVKEEFAKDYIFPMLKSGAIYESRYYLGTSIARPLIAKVLVEIAIKENAVAICHGCTGKGNDQVRFELAIKSLAPHIQIIAPWRIWDITSRDQEIEYLQQRNLPVPMKKEESYSRDLNLWHISHEGLDLENPENAPNYDTLLKLGTYPEKAPENAETITITFEKGEPTHLNDQALSPAKLIEELNKLGGKHGIGIEDIVENRVVGMKSRGVYETPGGKILYYAHEMIEHLTLDRETYQYKQQVALEYSRLIYDGKWFTPLRDALAAFVDSTQRFVSGKVTLKLYKGNIISQGAASKYSLYSEDLASFTTGDLYNHHDADGFITLFGLPSKVRALMHQKNEGK
ncbi:argininosuccinate synthase [Candidatus Epulonipiscium viviparus]|uniref:argininosuccinate synthase n=1 Tax=Candidatus Epulonipiscium viviparus TaxID=420336 RepID=UPI00273811AF|nr:argininosuccinate synthase [Candidatus Epulopiscium viviparus]